MVARRRGGGSLGETRPRAGASATPGRGQMLRIRGLCGSPCTSGDGRQVAWLCGGFALKICLKSNQQLWRDGDGEACGWVENGVEF